MDNYYGLFIDKQKILMVPVALVPICDNNPLYALLLNQLHYWSTRTTKGWVWKTDDEWKQELFINRHTIRQAKDFLIEKGFIEAKVFFNQHGKKATHYKLNMEIIVNAVELHKKQSLNSDNTTTLEDNGKRDKSANSDFTKRDKSANSDNHIHRLPKEHRLPEESKDSYQQDSRSGERLLVSRRKILDKPEIVDEPKTKKQKTLVIPEELLPFFNHYYEVTGTKYKLDTVRTKTSLASIKGLINGTLYEHNKEYQKYHGKKFTIFDFRKSLRRFADACTNPNVAPKNKDVYRKLSVGEFLLNPRFEHTKSLFLYFLDNEPKPLNAVVADNQGLAEAIQQEYHVKVLGHAATKFSSDDIIQFNKAAVELEKFIFENNSNIRQMYIKTNKEKASLLVNAVLACSKNDGHVPPFYLASHITINRWVPDYFQKQGIFKDTNNKWEN